MDIHIADEKERGALYRLREEVFVAEQGVPRELELDKEDAYATHLAATEDGCVVGCARLLFEGDAAHLGRLAVKRSERSRGIGSAIVMYAVSLSTERGFSQIWLNSQVQAIPFYEKLGFHRVGDDFFEAGIRHVRMEKLL